MFSRSKITALEELNTCNAGVKLSTRKASGNRTCGLFFLPLPSSCTSLFYFFSLCNSLIILFYNFILSDLFYSDCSKSCFLLHIFSFSIPERWSYSFTHGFFSSLCKRPNNHCSLQFDNERHVLWLYYIAPRSYD